MLEFEHNEMSMIKFSYTCFILKIDADPENWPERSERSQNRVN